MAFESKVVQVWECAKCDITIKQSIQILDAYCRNGHKLKLIEGEKYLPKPRKKQLPKGVK